MEGDGEVDTQRGAPIEIVCVGGDVSPPEENVELPDFIPGRAHLMLQGVYVEFLYHNNR